MVSFWPFKGDDTSAATFEKTLSTLTTKLQKANERDASLRSRARRLKALWTLYTSFIYILYTLILALVTGYQRWGPPEYAAVLAGPVVIFSVRAALAAFYDYRLSTNAAYIKTVAAQRKAAIDKFKHATKYDSTQQLLEKYGAEQPRPAQKKQPNSKDDDGSDNGTPAKQTKQHQPAKPQPARTNLPPPPTANIQRPPGMQGGPAPASMPPPASPPQAEPAIPSSPDGPAFAPPAAAQYVAPAAQQQPQWYDRVLDVLLGDDETKAINRVALICEHCRLVNGQAPAGVRDVAELGRWRCGGCKGWNGRESEVSQILDAAGAGEGAVATDGDFSGGGGDDAVAEAAERDEPVEQMVEIPPAAATPARSTRSRTAKAHDADP